MLTQIYKYTLFFKNLQRKFNALNLEFCRIGAISGPSRTFSTLSLTVSDIYMQCFSLQQSFASCNAKWHQIVHLKQCNAPWLAVSIKWKYCNSLAIAMPRTFSHTLALSLPILHAPSSNIWLQEAVLFKPLFKWYCRTIALYLQYHQHQATTILPFNLFVSIT